MAVLNLHHLTGLGRGQVGMTDHGNGEEDL